MRKIERVCLTYGLELSIDFKEFQNVMITVGDGKRWIVRKEGNRLIITQDEIATPDPHWAILGHPLSSPNRKPEPDPDIPF